MNQNVMFEKQQARDALAMPYNVDPSDRLLEKVDLRAVGVELAEADGVAEDGECAGGEGIAAAAEGWDERGPERGGVGRGECVVLVEDDPAEAEAPERGPVDPPDVRRREVREREARLAHRRRGSRGGAARVEALPRRAPPPAIATHGAPRGVGGAGSFCGARTRTKTP